MTAPLFDLPQHHEVVTDDPVAGCFERRATSRRTRRIATYSADQRFRYALRIQWAPGPLVQFIGCNPSTATELEDDPTVRKCIAYAQSWGRAGMIMTNVCALRATDPKVMLSVPEARGDGNSPDFLARDRGADMVVGCWGANPLKRRDLEPHVADIKRALGRRLLAFRLTKGGHPEHPLYLPSHLEPRPFADLAAELVVRESTDT